MLKNVSSSKRIGIILSFCIWSNQNGFVEFKDGKNEIIYNDFIDITTNGVLKEIKNNPSNDNFIKKTSRKSLRNLIKNKINASKVDYLVEFETSDDNEINKITSFIQRNFKENQYSITVSFIKTNTICENYGTLVLKDIYNSNLNNDFKRIDYSFLKIDFENIYRNFRLLNVSTEDLSRIVKERDPEKYIRSILKAKIFPSINISKHLEIDEETNQTYQILSLNSGVRFILSLALFERGLKINPKYINDLESLMIDMINLWETEIDPEKFLSSDLFMKINSHSYDSLTWVDLNPEWKTYLKNFTVPTSVINKE